MKIYLTGSRDLTELDKNEIYDYLDTYGCNHEIHILCDRTIENEVLKFFIENEEFANKLHVYTFQPYSMLPSFLKKPIEYLRTKGTSYTSFNMEEMRITRTPFVECLQQVMEKKDLVMCFYNGDDSKRLIPVDVAKEEGIDAMVCDLPGTDETKTKISLEQKVRVV